MARIKTKTTDDQAPKTHATHPDAIADTRAPAHTPRPASKLALVLALLEAPEGITIAEIMDTTGWQSHTVRGALSGIVTKKLGRIVISEKLEGRGRVYKIAKPSI